LKAIYAVKKVWLLSDYKTLVALEVAVIE